MSHWKIWDFFYTEMFIEQFTTLHMTFVQIVEIDWLLEQLKSIFHKNIQNILLRNYRRDGADTLYVTYF